MKFSDYMRFQGCKLAMYLSRRLQSKDAHEQNKKEIAHAMFTKSMPLEMIEQVSGINMEELKKIFTQ
jgi:ABC-type branched-subunit amino acid transport system ATPase component